MEVFVNSKGSSFQNLYACRDPYLLLLLNEFFISLLYMIFVVVDMASDKGLHCLSLIQQYFIHINR